MRPKDSDLFHTYRGPLSVVRACKWCPHVELIKKGVRGAGRGYGMREGNKARGRIITHVRENHPEEYEKARGGPP